MNDTIIFNGTDNEEQIEITAQELKNYVNETQDVELSEIKTRLDNLELQTEELSGIKTKVDDLEIQAEEIPAIKTTVNDLEVEIEEISGIKERLESIEIATQDLSENFTSENESTKQRLDTLDSTVLGLSESINLTNDSISQEVSSRQSATEALRTELTEYTDSEIEKEKVARTNFDNVLQSQIQQEYSDRQEADRELETRLLQEISSCLTTVDFASADRIVKSDLTTLIENVQTVLSTEIKELEGKVDEVRTSLNEETANRIKADNALQGSSGGSTQTDYSSNYELMTIDQLEKGEVSGDSIFLQSYNLKDSFVTASQIKTWMACASQEDFENEVRERKTEDSRLESKLTTETTMRTEADSNLQNQINGLDTRTSKTESTLKTLTGTGEGSIQKSISDKIAEVVSDAPEAFDTLKEIANWVGTHENDVLSMQGAISENASAIVKETEDRTNDVAQLHLNLETETTNRINTDETLRESIVNLSFALEAETAERENTKNFIHDTLKEEFENQITDLTNNTIGGLIDDRCAEIVAEVAKNTQNIAILDDEVKENKQSIETLNETVFAEKDAEKLLISTTSGTPKWDTLSSLIKSVTVNTNSIDERGNVRLNVPSTAKIVSFYNGSNSIDGFLVPFHSSNGQWYVHVANWWGGIYGNGTVRGTAYYIE